MARARSAHFEEQRNHILEAAAQAFAQHSYPATSMNDLAQACGTSKARLYHYYPSKDAILFDLLQHYTARLNIVATQAALFHEAQPHRVDKTTITAKKHARVQNRHDEPEQGFLRALVCGFLAEYQTSRTRHIVLLNDVKFLPDDKRTLIVHAQRTMVATFRRALLQTYPQRVTRRNASAITMMLFGMMNWTFTWLKPTGKISYSQFAQEVLSLLEHGLQKDSSLRHSPLTPSRSLS